MQAGPGGVLVRARLRRILLGLAGRSWPARACVRRRCRAAGVQLRGANGRVELQKGDRLLLLAPSQIFLAPEICGDFEAFAQALPTTEKGGVRTTDYAAEPDALDLCRRCLQAGVRVEKKDGAIWLYKDVRAMVLLSAHFVYAPDMARQFELYFTPLVPEQRGELQVLDYFQPGKLQTYRRSGLQFEMASFPEEEDAIEEYSDGTDRVRVIWCSTWAHCGVSTFYLSKLVGPEGRVVSFEPDPVNHAI